MTRRKDVEMHDAMVGWLEQHPMKTAIAVSLTFKPALGERSLTLDAAHNAVRMYCRMLNSRAYGRAFRKKKKRLAVFPVREGGSGLYDKHIHYHLQVEVPDGWNIADWLDAACEEWKHIRWASRHQNRFREVTDANWLSYELKTRDKPSYADAIDWELVTVN